MNELDEDMRLEFVAWTQMQTAVVDQQAMKSARKNTTSVSVDTLWNGFFWMWNRPNLLQRLMIFVCTSKQTLAHAGVLRLDSKGQVNGSNFLGCAKDSGGRGLWNRPKFFQWLMIFVCTSRQTLTHGGVLQLDLSHKSRSNLYGLELDQRLERED